MFVYLDKETNKQLNNTDKMNIKNSIITRHNHEEEYYSCIVGYCHNDSSEIDIVSRDEFSKRGWLITDNPIYSSDMGLVAICPECVETGNVIQILSGKKS